MMSKRDEEGSDTRAPSFQAAAAKSKYPRNRAARNAESLPVVSRTPAGSANKEGTSTGPQEAMQAGPEESPRINAWPKMNDAGTVGILTPLCLPIYVEGSYCPGFFLIGNWAKTVATVSPRRLFVPVGFSFNDSILRAQERFRFGCYAREKPTVN